MARFPIFGHHKTMLKRITTHVLILHEDKCLWGKFPSGAAGSSRHVKFCSCRTICIMTPTPGGGHARTPVNPNTEEETARNGVEGTRLGFLREILPYLQG